MELIKSKTFWAGVSALVTAGAGYATGEMAAAAAIQTAFTGIIGIFLRSAIAKQG